MQNFAMRSTALLHKIMDRSDPVWECWAAHCRYLKIVNQTQFTEEEVLDLHHAILDHHKAYSALYPGTKTPKFHWVLHMAFDIFWNGPLRPMCCLRMEARHQYFKRLIKVTNRTNPLFTLASRYMRHVALALHDTQPRQLVELCGYQTQSEMDTDQPDHVGEQLLGFDSVLALCAGASSTILTVTWSASVRYLGDNVEAGSAFLFSSLGNTCVGLAQNFIDVHGLCFVQFFQYEFFQYDIEGHRAVASASSNPTDRAGHGARTIQWHNIHLQVGAIRGWL